MRCTSVLRANPLSTRTRLSLSFNRSQKPILQKLLGHGNWVLQCRSASTQSKTAAPPLLRLGKSSPATEQLGRISSPGTSSVWQAQQSKSCALHSKSRAVSNHSLNHVSHPARCPNQSNTRWGSLRTLCIAEDSNGPVAKMPPPHRGPTIGLSAHSFPHQQKP